MSADEYSTTSCPISNRLPPRIVVLDNALDFIVWLAAALHNQGSQIWPSPATRPLTSMTSSPGLRLCKDLPGMLSSITVFGFTAINCPRTIKLDPSGRQTAPHPHGFFEGNGVGHAGHRTHPTALRRPLNEYDHTKFQAVLRAARLIINAIEEHWNCHIPSRRHRRCPAWSRPRRDAGDGSGPANATACLRARTARIQ